MDLDHLIIDLAQRGGHELHLSAGRLPLFRIGDKLLPQDTFPHVIEDELRTALYTIMGAERAKLFEKDLSTQFAYEIPGFARIRVFAFVARGAISATFGLIPLEVPTIDGMGLPAVLKDVADLPSGLVLICGGAHQGKTVTLTAMLQHINQNNSRHILMIEDPMEFVFSDELSAVSQLELGQDTQSFAQAERVVTRADVDVVAPCVPVTPELLEKALRWAESGRLVFLQMLAPDAHSALEETLVMLNATTHSAPKRLGRSLRAVFAQRLAKRADGQGRCAAIEIAINSPAIRELIEAGNLKDLEKAMMEGAHCKMQTFNMALYRLFKAGAISEDEALETSGDPEHLTLMMRGIRRGSTADEMGRSGFRKDPKDRKPGEEDDDDDEFDLGALVPIKRK